MTLKMYCKGKYLKSVGRRIKEIIGRSSNRNPYRAVVNDDSALWENGQKIGMYLRRKSAVPKGCVAVYVGEQRWRFVIPTMYLSHPVFHVLLEKAREEYGFHQREGLTIPCDVEEFEHSLWLIRLSQTAAKESNVNVERLVEEFIVRASVAKEEIALPRTSCYF